MTCVAGGGSGSGGGPPGGPPWGWPGRRGDGHGWLPSKKEEEEEDEPEADPNDPNSWRMDSLRVCRLCRKKSYGRHGLCLNMDCVDLLVARFGFVFFD